VENTPRTELLCTPKAALEGNFSAPFYTSDDSSEANSPSQKGWTLKADGVVPDNFNRNTPSPIGDTPLAPYQDGLCASEENLVFFFEYDNLWVRVSSLKEVANPTDLTRYDL
jgi:hypothetical protein